MRIKTIKAAKTARKSQRLGDILLIKSSPLIGASLQLVNKTDDNVNIETLKNKMLSQQIKYQDESLTKDLFIYTAPILRVYSISDNTEKVITDTDFDKWYESVFNDFTMFLINNKII